MQKIQKELDVENKINKELIGIYNQETTSLGPNYEIKSWNDLNDIDQKKLEIIFNLLTDKLTTSEYFDSIQLTTQGEKLDTIC